MEILFIGNSYTYYNDMEKIFTRECKKKADDFRTLSVAFGGYSLRQYLSDQDSNGQLVKQILLRVPLDYVVLQEHSVRPITEKEDFLRCVSEFSTLIRSNSAKPVLYETWGRADGNETLSKLGLTHDEMQDKLREAYETAAKENDAILVYAGDRFHEAYRAGADVFDPDGSHPSLYGSQIIAKEFCRVLIK